MLLSGQQTVGHHYLDADKSRLKKNDLLKYRQWKNQDDAKIQMSGFWYRPYFSSVHILAPSRFVHSLDFGEPYFFIRILSIRITMSGLYHEANNLCTKLHKLNYRTHFVQNHLYFLFTMIKFNESAVENLSFTKTLWNCVT